MKNIKNILTLKSIFLFMVFSIFLLTGCGKKDDSTTKSDDKKTQSVLVSVKHPSSQGAGGQAQLQGCVQPQLFISFSHILLFYLICYLRRTFTFI